MGSLKHEFKPRGLVKAMDLNPTDFNPDTGFGIISKYTYTGGFRDVGEAWGGGRRGNTNRSQRPKEGGRLAHQNGEGHRPSKKRAEKARGKLNKQASGRH